MEEGPILGVIVKWLDPSTNLIFILLLTNKYMKKSFSTIQFVANLLQPTGQSINKIIHVYFNHMLYSHDLFNEGQVLTINYLLQPTI